MKDVLKWFLAASVVLAVLAVVGTSTADAARWRAYARGYPAYYGRPVYRGAYYYGPRRVAPPPVVYRAPVVVAPLFPRAVYRPLWIPRPAPYWGW